jgi:hypothetical protein
MRSLSLLALIVAALSGCTTAGGASNATSPRRMCYSASTTAYNPTGAGLQLCPGRMWDH